VQDVVDERQANTLHVNVDFHLHALQLTCLHAQQLHAIKQTDTNIRLVTYFFQDNLEMPVPFCILIRQQIRGFGMAVALAKPYAKNLHLAPQR